MIRDLIALYLGGVLANIIGALQTVYGVQMPARANFMLFAVAVFWPVTSLPILFFFIWRRRTAVYILKGDNKTVREEPEDNAPR